MSTYHPCSLRKRWCRQSTVATELALILADSGNRVGVLDIDLTGPSLPEMFDWLTASTSDEHISIVEYLQEFNPDGAVIVTTPQAVSLADECSDLFSKGGGEALATEKDIRFLGRIPIDPQLSIMIETSRFADTFRNSPLHAMFSSIAEKLLSPATADETI
ncbi:hypothetical protein BSLG_005801 [Batrachochytrium salamandrivorans]|nr:hypothetical protein BSLG_005801 [Batrachochytrium salamandrivorans]